MRDLSDARPLNLISWVPVERSEPFGVYSLHLCHRFLGRHVASCRCTPTELRGVDVMQCDRRSSSALSEYPIGEDPPYDEPEGDDE